MRSSWYEIGAGSYLRHCPGARLRLVLAYHNTRSADVSQLCATQTRLANGAETVFKGSASGMPICSDILETM